LTETEEFILSPRPKILSSLIPKDSPRPVSLLAVPAKRILPVFLFSFISKSIETEVGFSLKSLSTELIYLKVFK